MTSWLIYCCPTSEDHDLETVTTLRRGVVASRPRAGLYTRSCLGPWCADGVYA